MEFKMRTGIVTGREHIVYGINCQDSVNTKSFDYKGNSYLTGVVSDGCGEGKKSEVGSHLATSFVSAKMEQLIKKGLSETEIPSRIFKKLLNFLRSIMDSYGLKNHPEEEVSFIRDHLLFTVIGFIIGPKDTVIFATGDGVVILNEDIVIRDQQNSPSYPAYHLIKSKYLKTPLYEKFDIYTIKTEELQNLAIGSDSWQSEIEILKLLSDANNKQNLQRTMNLLSQKERRFKDDATLIVVTRST